MSDTQSYEVTFTSVRTVVVLNAADARDAVELAREELPLGTNVEDMATRHLVGEGTLQSATRHADAVVDGKDY